VRAGVDSASKSGTAFRSHGNPSCERHGSGLRALICAELSRTMIEG